MKNSSIAKRARAYYHLTKPGIIRGNLLTTTAGFCLAAGRDLNLRLLVFTLTGTALIIAAGCVLNNLFDRDIDQRMTRTQNRALVRGEITPQAAVYFAIILAVIGVGLLAAFVNGLTAALGVIGLGLYVFVYTPAKRKTAYAALIGSLPGAVPPVAGYVAVSGHIDAAAILLFVILACWQIPHFYAIAMYRKREYKNADIPVITITQGNRVAKIHMISFMVLFILAVSGLTIAGYTGISYLVIMLLLAIWWLQFGLKGLTTTNDEHWAKGVFGISLAVNLGLCLVIVANAWLP